MPKRPTIKPKKGIRKHHHFRVTIAYADKEEFDRSTTVEKRQRSLPPSRTDRPSLSTRESSKSINPPQTFPTIV